MQITPTMEFDFTPAREEITAALANLGFRFASSLPTIQEFEFRPKEEIAKRLLAIKVVTAWVCSDEEHAPTARLREAMEKWDLVPLLSKKERNMYNTPRQDLPEEFRDQIGWAFEDAWSLAWLLGFPHKPEIDGEMITPDVIRAVLFDFAPPLDDFTGWLAVHELVDLQEAALAEHIFYCTHNAARSAMLGRPGCVPEGFHPVAGGGVIQERRQGLTWAMSPGVAWDDTDVST